MRIRPSSGSAISVRNWGCTRLSQFEVRDGAGAQPNTQARQLAGVSMRRLRYWEEVGLVVPSIKRHLSEHNTVRLYSYQALLVVSALRTERDMSLQKIRRIVKHLRSRGYQAPLRELKFATVGREVYFQHPTALGKATYARTRSSYMR